jgi:dephospho-CoA kinase
MSFNYAFALTGGIATGKSTVLEQLKLSGFRIIDADQISHDVIDEQSSKIEEMFGKEFVKDSKVDRKALGAVIFVDKAKRKQLEKLLHPIIYRNIKEKADKLDRRGEPYIVDIPLFYENGNYAIANVIVVYAPREKQIQRVMKRDNFTKEEAILRIDSQLDIEQKKDNALYVIDNSSNLKHLEVEVNRVKEEILGDNI